MSQDSQHFPPRPFGMLGIRSTLEVCDTHGAFINIIFCFCHSHIYVIVLYH